MFGRRKPAPGYDDPDPTPMVITCDYGDECEAADRTAQHVHTVRMPCGCEWDDLICDECAAEVAAGIAAQVDRLTCTECGDEADRVDCVDKLARL